jgi:hypothetical protein
MCEGVVKKNMTTVKNKLTSYVGRRKIVARCAEWSTPIDPSFKKTGFLLGRTFFL